MNAAAIAELEHDHEWHLVSVDFDGDLPVKEYECAGCAAVWFDS